MNPPMNNTTTTEFRLHVDIPSLRILIAIICIILYLFGYTGCLLSIVTFSSKKLRRHSTGFLFLVMACVDLFNLIASLQYFLDVIYQINVFAISIHWCRFFTIFNYELYFGFSWVFAFISIDRWIKVEWPTKSQSICTRKRFIHLCLFTLVFSLIQNVIYTFLCINDECGPKSLGCEIFVHSIYISLYMTIPIAIILISICRTCLITLHLKKRFRTSTYDRSAPTIHPTIRISKSDPTAIDDNHHSHTITTRLSNSFISTPSITTSATTTTTTTTTATTVTMQTKCQPLIDSRARLANYTSYLHRRRSGLDAQMIMLISINVAPFIFVHIVNEIAYLFEKYSSFVAHSNAARFCIILVYLSWYFISATRFYTNCLLSRIYREEFKSRLHMLRRGCKPGLVIVNSVQSNRQSSRYYVGAIVNAPESSFAPVTHLAITNVEK